MELASAYRLRAKCSLAQFKLNNSNMKAIISAKGDLEFAEKLLLSRLQAARLSLLKMSNRSS